MRFKPEEILESNTSIEIWKLEVERVAPSLKITVKNDARDWRVHLEQMHQYRHANFIGEKYDTLVNDFTSGAELMRV